jgi:hypothetical protein
MLHASKTNDGKLSMTTNSVNKRNIPSDASYKVAHNLLLHYFEHTEGVNKAFKFTLPNAAKLFTRPEGGLKKIKINGKLKPPKKLPLMVACLILTETDAFLFENSVLTLEHSGGSKHNIVAVTSNPAVYKIVKTIVPTVIFFPKVGFFDEKNSQSYSRRKFLQAWMAYTGAELGVSMLWQSPGTVWLKSPDVIYSLVPPEAEIIVGYKGRSDPRASPFFISYDFIWIEPSDRPIHFAHEVMLHADLIDEWKSLDAVGSYRLNENNARY